MGLGYDIGDRVMQIEDKVIGEVIKFYYPTACGQQTMILRDDGRKYHASSHTFVKVNEPEEEIVSKIKSRPSQLARKMAMPLTQELTQPLLVPHDYRNVKVSENITITINLEDLKKQLVESYYKRIGLNYGA